MDASDSPRPRLPGELTFALAMLLLGLTAFWLSYRIAGFSSWSSAGSVPLGTTYFMCVSAVVFIFGTLRKPSVHATPDNAVPRLFFEKIFPVRHMLFTAVIILYMVALEPLGFLLSSFLYLTLSTLVLGERRYARMTVVNLLTLAAVYLVFQTAFSVVLPVGPVERIFR